MERSKEQSLMTEIEQADADLAESVRGLMFTFDDLLSLDGKSLQSLLKEVNPGQLGAFAQGRRRRSQTTSSRTSRHEPSR